MVPDLRLAIQLQDLDRHITQLQREIASLPKHIAAIEKTLESHLRKLEADRAALAANLRERRSLEGDIQTSQQRISKLRDQMLSGQDQRAVRRLRPRDRILREGYPQGRRPHSGPHGRVRDPRAER